MVFRHLFWPLVPDMSHDVFSRQNSECVNEHLKFTFVPPFFTRFQLHLFLKNVFSGISQKLFSKERKLNFDFPKILHCGQRSQGSLVGVVTRLYAGRSGVRNPVGAKGFSSKMTGCRAHPPSYSVGTWVFSWG